MLQRIAKLWRTLRERVARQRAEIVRWRAEAARQRAAARALPHAEIVRVLQEWLDCARVDLTRERRAVARQHIEIEELKAEVVRLRLDNRALLNSLLGTAGIPPLEAPRTGADAPAVRRPSWPQIAAKREAAAARQLEAERRRQDAKQ